MSRPQDKSICPICFTLYPIAQARSEYPMCPECESEAIGVEVEPLDQFLESQTVEGLRKLLAKWDKAEGFHESYKRVKYKRIEAVIEMKETAERPRR